MNWPDTRSTNNYGVPSVKDLQASYGLTMLGFFTVHTVAQFRHYSKRRTFAHGAQSFWNWMSNCILSIKTTVPHIGPLCMSKVCRELAWKDVRKVHTIRKYTQKSRHFSKALVPMQKSSWIFNFPKFSAFEYCVGAVYFLAKTFMTNYSSFIQPFEL